MSHKLFSPDALRSVVRTGDCRQFNIAEDKLRGEIESASAVMLLGGVNLTDFHITPIKNRNCVSYKNYDIHLLLRSITKYLRRRFRISSPSRDQIVRGLIEATLDATPGFIVRRDIRSFYESLPIEDLQRKLAYDTATPPLIRDYLEKFFATHSPDRVGIPRGTPISPLLADIAMQKFDEAVRSAPGVYRYYRFADDIIALTTEPAEDLARLMDEQLPHPMKFNQKKTHNVQLGREATPMPPPAIFEYLGYRFTANQTKEKRDSRVINVSLSERKIRRLKSRIVLAIKSHTASPDWRLLQDRMRFLTSNHRLLRGHVAATKDSPYIQTGLYYNYRACGTYSFVRGAFSAGAYDRRELKEIDGFYHSALRRLMRSISSAESHIADLKRISFHRSYELKIHCDFEATRIAEIKSCWRNM